MIQRHRLVCLFLNFTRRISQSVSPLVSASVRLTRRCHHCSFFMGPHYYITWSCSSKLLHLSMWGISSWGVLRKVSLFSSVRNRAIPIKHSTLRVEDMGTFKKVTSVRATCMSLSSLSGICYHIGFTGLVCASVTFRSSYPCAVRAAPGGFVTGKGSLFGLKWSRILSPSTCPVTCGSQKGVEGAAFLLLLRGPGLGTELSTLTRWGTSLPPAVSTTGI